MLKETYTTPEIFTHTLAAKGDVYINTSNVSANIALSNLMPPIDSEQNKIAVFKDGVIAPSDLQGHITTIRANYPIINIKNAPVLCVQAFLNNPSIHIENNVTYFKHLLPVQLSATNTDYFTIDINAYNSQYQAVDIQGVVSVNNIEIYTTAACVLTANIVVYKL